MGFKAHFLESSRPRAWPRTHNLLTLGLDLNIYQESQHATLDGCAKRRKQRDVNDYSVRLPSQENTDSKTNARRNIGLETHYLLSLGTQFQK